MIYLLTGKIVPSHAIPAEIGIVCQNVGTATAVADAVLHGSGDPTGPGSEAVRALVRAAFADDDPAWFGLVAARFDEVVAAALANLAR